MFERLLENWLDSASERGFQIPFCHVLIAEGHKLLHSTRHSAMEIGKDIVSIAPDGVPCAYQLKAIGGRRLTLSKYRKDLEHQVLALATCQIDHPSIPHDVDHRSYIVLNGSIDEEVQREIRDLSRRLVRKRVISQGITTIVKGELLARFKALSSNFWPQEAADVRQWLEVYMANGRGPLPRTKLARLAENALNLHSTKVLRGAQIAEAITGTSILVNWAISPFRDAKNHMAEIHALVVNMMCALAVAERAGAAEKHWAPHVRLLESACFEALEMLVREVGARPTLIEGDPLSDFSVRPVRVTELLGWAAVFGLWKWKLDGSERPPDSVLTILTSPRYRMLLWGEHALPQILAAYLFLRQVRPGLHTEAMLALLADQISNLNGPDRAGSGLPNPYYEADEVLPWVMGLEEAPRSDTFKGWSYGLETVIYLLALENLKATLRARWPSISRVMNARFQPAKRWNSYLWRSPGRLVLSEFPRPTEWKSLREGRLRSRVPRYLKSDPIRYLTFLLTYPHRIDAGSFLHAAKQLRASFHC